MMMCKHSDGSLVDTRSAVVLDNVTTDEAGEDCVSDDTVLSSRKETPFGAGFLAWVVGSWGEGLRRLSLVFH